MILRDCLADLNFRRESIEQLVVVLQSTSFWIHNSSFLIHNSSFLIHCSSFSYKIQYFYSPVRSNVGLFPRRTSSPCRRYQCQHTGSCCRLTNALSSLTSSASVPGATLFHLYSQQFSIGNEGSSLANQDSSVENWPAACCAAEVDRNSRTGALFIIKSSFLNRKSGFFKIGNQDSFH